MQAISSLLSVDLSQVVCNNIGHHIVVLDHTRMVASEAHDLNHTLFVSLPELVHIIKFTKNHSE